MTILRFQRGTRPRANFHPCMLRFVRGCSSWLISGIVIFGSCSAQAIDSHGSQPEIHSNSAIEFISQAFTRFAGRVQPPSLEEIEQTFAIKLKKYEIGDRPFFAATAQRYENIIVNIDLGPDGHWRLAAGWAAAGQHPLYVSPVGVVPENSCIDAASVNNDLTWLGWKNETPEWRAVLGGWEGPTPPRIQFEKDQTKLAAFFTRSGCLTDFVIGQ